MRFGAPGLWMPTPIQTKLLLAGCIGRSDSVSPRSSAGVPCCGLVSAATSDLVQLSRVRTGGRQPRGCTGASSDGPRSARRRLGVPEGSVRCARPGFPKTTQVSRPVVLQGRLDGDDARDKWAKFVNP